MLVPTFVAVPVGRWVDRRGYLRPTALALAGIVAGECAAVLLPTLPGLAITSLAVGTSFMLAHVAVNNAIGHIAGAAGRTRAFGLMAVGFSLSALAGPTLAGAAIDAVGYRQSFLLLGVRAIAVGLAAVAAARHAGGRAGTGAASAWHHRPVAAAATARGADRERHGIGRLGPVHLPRAAARRAERPVADGHRPGGRRLRGRQRRGARGAALRSCGA